MNGQLDDVLFGSGGIRAEGISTPTLNQSHQMTGLTAALVSAAFYGRIVENVLWRSWTPSSCWGPLLAYILLSKRRIGVVKTSSDSRIPRPRNTEKDVQVFLWKILAHALKRLFQLQIFLVLEWTILGLGARCLSDHRLGVNKAQLPPVLRGWWRDGHAHVVHHISSTAASPSFRLVKINN